MPDSQRLGRNVTGENLKGNRFQFPAMILPQSRRKTQYCYTHTNVWNCVQISGAIMKICHESAKGRRGIEMYSHPTLFLVSAEVRQSRGA
jgi:hypothetical protein